MRALLPALVVWLGLPFPTAHAQDVERGTQWTSSASDAYLIAAGSTVGGVGLGLALYHVFPPRDPDSDAFAPRDAALTLVALGAFFGPSMGNVALGAGDTAEVGLAIKGAGIAAGGAIALSSLVVFVGCGGGTSCGSTNEALFITGAVVAGVGLVAGTVYDVATIPRNAARAHAATRRVAVVPSGAGLALRIEL